MSKIKEAAEPAETVTLSLNPRQIQVRDCRDPTIRVLSRFFDPVGHETMYASSGNKHFSLNNVTVRPLKIMNKADKNFWKDLINFPH